MRALSLSALAVAATLSLPAASFAEDLDLNARPDTTLTTLATWSIGPAVGVATPVGGDLSDVSSQFLTLSISQSVRFQPNWDMNVDFDWWLPGNNFGGNLGVSYLIGDFAVKPFIGAGVGIRSVDYDGEALGKGLGAEGLVQAGVYLDVADNMQLRVRVPYRVIANSHRDQAAGLDIAMLFSSPLRKTKVKKLTYEP